jgi:hypothetical protein
MSDHDDQPIERLREIDRPRRPDPDATDRIRAQMLAAFDETAAGSPAHEGEPGAEIIVLSDAATSTDVEPGSSRLRRSWFYIAAAALAVVVGTMALVLSGGDNGDSGFADTPVLVQAFCMDIQVEVNTVADFIDRPGSERDTRALVALESIAQAIRNLGDDMKPDDAEPVRQAGDALLAQAAAARLLSGQTSDLQPELQSLASAIADEIDRLPESSACRTALLRSEP